MLPIYKTSLSRIENTYEMYSQHTQKHLSHLILFTAQDRAFMASFGKAQKHALIAL